LRREEVPLVNVGQQRRKHEREPCAQRVHILHFWCTKQGTGSL
jgi:hypothetical protein